MVVTGIVAEYNPFHNGHLYHMEQARKQTAADFLVVIMSGDFVQRGAPAILCKEERARMALEAGADLILELPVCYATASAELFAGGAIFLLHSLGCVDYLCFGSESGNISQLNAAASILLNEGALFQSVLQHNLKHGATYAAAMEQALKAAADEAFLVPGHLQESVSLRTVTASPNNLLGIEYIKALRRLHSRIIPVTIQRQGTSYTDCQLSSASSFSSASAIRTELISRGVTRPLRDAVPESVFLRMKELENCLFPIVTDDFSSQLNYARLMAGDYQHYYDISKEMANRMEKKRFQGYSFEEMILELKTKQYTYNRISRGLLHLMLGITKEEMVCRTPSYARILGFRRSALPLLHEMKKKSMLPLITKLAAAEKNAMLQLDIRSSHMYHMAVYEKFKTQLPDEYRREILIF